MALYGRIYKIGGQWSDQDQTQLVARIWGAEGQYMGKLLHQREKREEVETNQWARTLASSTLISSGFNGQGRGAARRCQEKRPKVRHSEIMCWGHAHALQNQGVFKKLQRMQGGEEFETEVPNDSEEVLCEFEEALEGM